MQEERAKTAQEVQQIKKNDRLSYRKYLFRQKIPRQYGRIVLPEVILSLILYLLVRIGAFTYSSYIATHVIALIFYWGLIVIWAERSRIRCHSLKHYYYCNLGAFALFLLTAAIAFAANWFSGLYPRDYVYYYCFRLSYSFGLLNDTQIAEEEVFGSLAAFYLVTFLILMIEPMIVTFAEDITKWKSKHRRHHRHHHHHHHHHHHEHSEHSEQSGQKNA